MRRLTDIWENFQKSVGIIHLSHMSEMPNKSIIAKISPENSGDISLSNDNHSLGEWFKRRLLAIM